jgi:hypothetical protein
MKTNIAPFFIILWTLCFSSASEISAADTSPQFVKGSDTLVVYTDVPGRHQPITNGLSVIQILHDLYILLSLQMLRVLPIRESIITPT